MTHLLRQARKRLFERRWYGRSESDEYIEDQYNRWNTQPPTRMRFCEGCGSEVRWIRESSRFSVKTGKPGHMYHLKCVKHGVGHWHDRKTGEVWYDIKPPFQGSRGQWEDVPVDDDRIGDIYFDSGFGFVGYSQGLWCDHYDSHEYRFREGDRESYDVEDLW